MAISARIARITFYFLCELSDVYSFPVFQKNILPVTKAKKCPLCRGTGLSKKGVRCKRCNGTGEIIVSQSKNVVTGEQQLTSR